MSSPFLAKDLDSSTYTVHAPREALPLNLAPVVPVPKQINVESREIYHGLPIYGEEFHGKSALIAGANGISGAYMLKVMRDYVCDVPPVSRPFAAPQLNYDILRPQMNDVPDWFSSHAIDLFNTDAQGVAKTIEAAGIKEIDYAFFYAFMPVAASDSRTLFKEAEELAEINGKIFHNFLEGLYLAGLRPKRILLQTGCKGYGQHYGPMICPLIEDSVPNARNYKEPNFYYSQEDVLWKFCKRTGIEWVDSRPSFIVGLVKDNNLNFLSPLMLYAAVSKLSGEEGTGVPRWYENRILDLY
ncbi:hypothetical protein EDD37DRAFT_610584 [Exophiala viscosa]|uniref:uncharacterized protein n=1 Tax=Exophiala viscosa TaxID=2486360 RepID=UPI002197C14A|nr:hypothetical protein EDD37DRAFT_610584 [Exophiala viscosa]